MFMNKFETMVDAFYENVNCGGELIGVSFSLIFHFPVFNCVILEDSSELISSLLSRTAEAAKVRTDYSLISSIYLIFTFRRGVDRMRYHCTETRHPFQ